MSIKPWLLALVASGATLSKIPSARAEGGAYDQCNQILANEVLNKTRTDTSSKLFSSALVMKSLFALSDSDAYSRYSRDFDEAQQKGSSFGLQAQYAGFGAGFSTGGTSGRKLTESEFSAARSRARQEYNTTEHTQSQSGQEYASTSLSELRDTETVRAWKDCVTRSPETGVYAVASRDDAGRVSVNVLWAPGALATIAPSIPVSFVTDEGDGVKVNAQPVETVAFGSGRTFSVQCGKACDTGFRVAVNATLSNDRGQIVNSFTNSVVVSGANPDKLLNDVLAAKGPTIASQDPLSVELREQQPEGRCRRAFDIGMAASEGQTLPGPGKTRIGNALSVAEQPCYWAAVNFALARNKYREFAANGATVAQRDPAVAAARKVNPSISSRLGFDIAAGIFADPASGGAGHTLEGPGSKAARDSLDVDGQAGFRAAVDLFLVQKHKPAPR